VRRKLLIGAAMVPLILATLAARIIKAEPRPDSAAPDDSNSCDRACLDGFVNRYLDAVVAHDPSRLPFTKNVKFTEDGQRLALGDGFWRTASARGSYKFCMEDVPAGQVAFFGTMREAGHPVSLALRLKIEDRKISEVETIVVRQGMISSRPSDTGATDFEKLGGPDPLFLQDVPPAQRVSRDELAKSANKYFSGMQRNDGKGDYSFFADDCSRVENGIVATNGHEGEAGPIGSGAQNNSGQNSSNQSNASRNTSYATLAGCKTQFQSGLLHFVTRIRDRRFVILDTQRGVALAFTFFDHAAGNTRTFQTPDGRTVTAGPTEPWTWEIAEAFKVENGQIRRIQAIFHRCPYGMGSGWSTWEESMSDRPRW
jgi:hypothetical protein